MPKKVTNDKLPGLHLKQDNLQELLAATRVLVRSQVLVGVPEETTDDREAGEPGPPVTNAALAYIHDNGAPEANIPARPFMIPGIEAVREDVTKVLARAASYALSGNAAKVDEGFRRVGTIVSTSVRRKIDDGVPPPLADATVARRAARGRKGAKQELANRAAGMAPSLDLAKPLIDTGEMRKSITYVVRRRAAGGA